MNNYYPLTILVLFLLISPNATAQKNCSSLNKDSSQYELVSYLQSALDASPSQKDNECIAFALGHLDYKPSAKAVRIVVRYLDFERPLLPEEKMGFAIHGPLSAGGLYPAISTLMSFGEVAIPPLLKVIGDTSSPLEKDNATHAIMAIFRDHPVNGIKLLQHEAFLSPPNIALNFTKAADNAVQWCGNKYREECQAANTSSTAN